MSTIPDWLDDYRREVERWNASINLISRRGSAAQLDRLITQCLDALDQLLEAPAPLGFAPGAKDGSSECAYFDLGSGGGLPGIVWHGRLVRGGSRVRSWLVEPREKRAWFLSRTARLMSPQPAVLHGLWGEVASCETLMVPQILISLKALRLDDNEVLAGLRPFLAESAAEVTIARFYPPDHIWSAELAATLAVAEPGESRKLDGLVATALAAGVLPPAEAVADAASLVISKYMVEAMARPEV